ncbi:MAG: GDP-mannose 4,6-dehydratase [Candidatus Omnitrophica bacterium CG11_big_fil_rev_8_21_14_0_20_64_10]|nr:MAG: GDP-mannose 4,6-dehydratase [Candidatus Omnitrophica bacterium CG11_big_fil_rev_8_21_14_0_20_64_10]
MKKILVTGITGFVGSHLAELYLGRRPDSPKQTGEVWGLMRRRGQRDLIRHLESDLHLEEGDVTDAHSMERLIAEIQPDVVHHLAAQSFVPLSWTAPSETLQANLMGSLNLLEAVRRHRPQAVVQVASSSEIYGQQEELPVTERHLPNPLSPYAVSKLAMDRLAAQYARSYGLSIMVTRAFNHTGPRRGVSFATSNFARQIIEIERGEREPVIWVGNLEAGRDWSDARDIVRAYALAVQKCPPGEPFNIASGVCRQVGEVLQQLLTLSGVRAEIRKDPKRQRPSDVPALRGDSQQFRKKTGWIPEIPWERTMRDLLDYWRMTLNGKTWVPS